MGIFTGTGNIDKRFAWSFLGTLIGAMGIVYAIYVDYFKEHKPNLMFEVQSNTNVLDLNEDIGKLEIIYNGEDIKKSNQNLRVLTIKVINQGIDIAESDYAQSIPFGFDINGGKIAERPEIIEVSNEYIGQSLKVNLDSSGFVKFTKIQLDQNQYFILKVLTITPLDTIPQIRTKGKISGIVNSIPVSILSQKGEQEKSFWQQMITGNFLLHFTRFWFYFLVLIIFSLSIILPVGLISESVEKKRRKRKLKKFEKVAKNKLGDQSDLIAHYYILHGSEFLRRLSLTLKDESRIKSMLELASNDKNRIEIFKRLGDIEFQTEQIRHHGHRVVQTPLARAVETLVSIGVIVEKDDRLTVDKNFVLALRELFNYVQTH